MRTWYQRERRVLAAAAACKALEEMSMVVAHFANAMGQQAAAGAAA